MSILPKELKFKYAWRSYQERVLKQLEYHLNDQKLHVIAPPGSGKTVLGLEVIRRLNKPALILSPTITIREQWIDRLKELFLDTVPENLDWLSRDLHSPALITCITYQALHSVFSGKQNESTDEDNDENQDINTFDDLSQRSILNRQKIIKRLKRIGVKVLVVDEAHHLRNEWWKSLTYLDVALEDAIVVALTATPPYDVSSSEWERYEKFCGPVDAEISVPELVLTNDICPHQDYIYFSIPSISEDEIIRKYRTAVQKFYNDTVQDPAFTACVLNHPFIQNPHQHLEAILENPQYFSSLLIFLSHIQQEVTHKHLRILGINKKQIPPLTLEWLEILLTELLFRTIEYYDLHKDVLDDKKRQLRQIGAVEHKRVTLCTNSTISQLLSTSASKHQSIGEIVKSENNSMNDKLRMVILTDYIRESSLPVSEDDIHTLDKMGVVTIFEYLRRNMKKQIRLGVLSGSIVIIPKDGLPIFKQIARREKIGVRNIKVHSLAADPDYLQIDITGEQGQRLVCTITELFALGHITVLVGTKSLLGEGWDSPTINSLILASFVGSYMLSNQMRGRAIRSLRDNPSKVSNIWHLVCVDGTSDPGDDYNILTRRFSAFVGVSHKQLLIEKGIARIGVGTPPFTSERIAAINASMVSLASKRDVLLKRWAKALESGTTQVEEVYSPKETVPKQLIIHKTIRGLFLQGVGIGSFVFSFFVQMARFIRDYEVHIKVLGIGLFAASLVALPKCARSLWLLIIHGPTKSTFREIAEVVVNTLIHMEEIRTKADELKIVTRFDENGSLYCALEGGSYFEQYLFRITLKEVLDPVKNPRYIVIRFSALFRWRKLDYHPVPNIIGQNKSYAKYFSKQWNDRLGFHRLIYTRTLEGRKILMRARFQSLAAAFQRKTEIVSSWR
jgi:superfamily II DNA or RNA helicase